MLANKRSRPHPSPYLHEPRHHAPHLLRELARKRGGSVTHDAEYDGRHIAGFKGFVQCTELIECAAKRLVQRHASIVVLSAGGMEDHLSIYTPRCHFYGRMPGLDRVLG